LGRKTVGNFSDRFYIEQVLRNAVAMSIDVVTKLCFIGSRRR